MNESIIYGVIASVIGALVFMLLSYLFKKRKDNVIRFVQSFKSLKTIGIKRVAATRTKAIELIWDDLLNSEKIMVLNYKGYSLLYDKNLSETLLYRLRQESKHLSSVEFLLLHPEASSIIEKRRNDIKSKVSSVDDSPNDIDTSIRILKMLNDDKARLLTCNCRLFEEDLKWSLVFSSNYILVSFYPKDEIALKSKCLIVYRNSMLGDSFEKYFNELWKNRSIDGYEYLSNKR